MKRGQGLLTVCARYWPVSLARGILSFIDHRSLYAKGIADIRVDIRQRYDVRFKENGCR